MVWDFDKNLNLCLGMRILSTLPTGAVSLGSNFVCLLWKLTQFDVELLNLV